jgi:hypothetical protein
VTQPPRARPTAVAPPHACRAANPRFGGPEVLDVVDLPDPVTVENQKQCHVSAAGVDYADTHHPVSVN